MDVPGTDGTKIHYTIFSCGVEKGLVTMASEMILEDYVDINFL